MACFFRRRVALQLAEVCGLSEDVFIPLISAVRVSKKQSAADLCVSVNSLLQNGAVAAGGDLQSKTQALVSQMKRDAVVEEVSAGRGVILFRLNKLILAQKLLEQLHSEPDVFGVKSELLHHLQGGRTLVEFRCVQSCERHRGLQGEPSVYVQVNREAERDESVRSAAAEFFRRLEQSEDQALALWRQFREITVDQYKRIYQRLGIHFDHYSGEAFHHHQTQSVLDELMSQGLLKTTEKGTAVVDLSGAGDMSSYATLVRSDGTSLYITRDVAAALDRKQRFGFDEMIYVTDKSQTVHFQQLFHILQTMGHQWAERCVHVAFGLVQGMSTRRGEVVFLEDVLEEARSRMLNNMRQSSTSKELEDPEQTAERVGISALIIQVGIVTCDTRVLMVCRYDEVLLQSANELQPRHLVIFLMTLSHLAASAHRELPVKGSSAAVAQARLCLFSAIRSVLANGMRILGITPVEKM
ncbi:putative arginine--tRNA ligase, mitochondrial [Sinocyclocheilus rhinocerous]|uniref:putative arginine--tRNA ligase, mitochondrial n=1 Tax=Sinocyclocheilus rhinocerous TaxID=307959 RepID=UPI0007B90CE2|nr:PREDICTED: probable arginine--tRNA ligase, mitochondrial [Sinocyclocheilus rhinocerous]